jgi:hypothetical protein
MKENNSRMEKRGKRGKEHGDVLSDYIKEFFES